jgi:hypothetical protein
MHPPSHWHGVLQLTEDAQQTRQISFISVPLHRHGQKLRSLLVGKTKKVGTSTLFWEAEDAHNGGVEAQNGALEAGA